MSLRSRSTKWPSSPIDWKGWADPTFSPVSRGLPAIFDKAPAQSDSCSAETAWPCNLNPHTAKRPGLDGHRLKSAPRGLTHARNRDGRSTVLAGAAVEALPLWAIQRDPKKLVGLGQKPKGAPEDWGLAGLIDVASALALIEVNTATQAHLAKNFRNLIHPGRARRTNEVCDRATALTALAAAELVVRDLS
jgi:hypothetical protein